VAGLSLALSTYASAASEVTYTIDFSTSPMGALAENTGTISVEAPTGTFPASPGCSSGVITVTDLTTKASNIVGGVCLSEVGSTGEHLVISSPLSIGTNNRVEVIVSGLDNPSLVGLHDLTVSTSSESARSVGFAIVKAGSISVLSFSRSDNSPAATRVTYNIGFTTSDTGALADGTGTISVEAASSTFPSSPACSSAIITVTDLTSNTSGEVGSVCLYEVGSKGNSLVFPSSVAIARNDRVEVVITGLDNPLGTGAYTLTVGTSSDAARSVGYNVAAPRNSVAQLSLAVSTSAARATEVTYTVDFTTSASGALAASSGRIILLAPVGTFPSVRACGEAIATVTDLTTTASGQDDLCDVTVSQGGAKLQLSTPVAIGAGQRASVAITGLDNPAVPGPEVLSLLTSSDGASSVRYTVTGHGIPLAAISLAVSTLAARATRVTYTVEVTTSPSGELAANFGTITLRAPTGTFPVKPPCGEAVAMVTDLSTKASGETDLCSATESDRGALLQLSTPVAISGGQRAEVAITGLDNPAKAGPQMLALSTSSNSSRSVSYHIVPGAPVTDVSVVQSNRAAGAAPVTYAVGFSTPATGALAAGEGTIGLKGPASTFPTEAECRGAIVSIIDEATNVSGNEDLCQATVAANGTGVELTTPVAIGAGQHAVVAITDLANPSTPGPQRLAIWTSSNGSPATGAYSMVPAGPVRGQVGDTSGHAVPGAEVEACPHPAGPCYDALTAPDGDYQEAVPYGLYTITAFPPQGASLAQSTRSSTVDVSGPAGAGATNITMQVLDPLPGNVSLGGQDGGVPVIYAGGTAPLVLRGCRHGVGTVTITGTNVNSGQVTRVILPLPEMPPGSGRYSVTIPPLWPIHGNVSFSYRIYCFEAIAPKAGLAAGGNMVAIHGSGFAGATIVKFGSARSPHFKVESSSLIEAVAPPGTGTVSVSVATPKGSTPKSALSVYSYISLSSIIPTDGPASGGTKVLITGTNLQDVDSVWFGDRLATNLQLVTDNEMVAYSPAGSGAAPLNIGEIGLVPNALERNKPSGLLFHYGIDNRSPASLQASSPRTVVPAPLGAALWPRGLARFVPAVSYGGGPPALTQWGTILTTAGGITTGLAGLVYALSTAFPGALALSGTYLTLTAEGLATVTVATSLGLAVSGVALVGGAAVVIGLVLSAVASSSGSSGGSCQCDLEPPGGGSGSSGGFSALVDPSGAISDVNGSPVRGATALLEQGPTADGPFSPAVAGSPGIEPHLNPQKTAANGQFHWDVISDFYKVEASAPGCHAPGDPAQKTVSTPALAVPPPRFGLALVLQCTNEAPPERPTITSLSGDIVADQGGPQLEVVGTAFTPSATVRFGLTPSRVVTYVSPNLLEVRVPPGTGRVHVFVSTGGGPSLANSADLLTYRPRPAVTELSPSSGRPAGGAQATIYGSGFTGAVLVSFGQVSVPSFKVESDDIIDATVPPGAKGTVDVKVTTLVGTSATVWVDRYTYSTPPPPRRSVARQRPGWAALDRAPL